MTAIHSMNTFNVSTSIHYQNQPIQFGNQPETLQDLVTNLGPGSALLIDPNRSPDKMLTIRKTDTDPIAPLVEQLPNAGTLQLDPDLLMNSDGRTGISIRRQSRNTGGSGDKYDIQRVGNGKAEIIFQLNGKQRTLTERAPKASGVPADTLVTIGNTAIMLNYRPII